VIASVVGKNHLIASIFSHCALKNSTSIKPNRKLKLIKFVLLNQSFIWFVDALL